METAIGVNRYRTIWISDIHLGTRGCKVDFLLDFLKHNESDDLYLVGDIIDGWALRRTWFGWMQSHNDIIQKTLRKVRKGTKAYYIPGNHDELARDFIGMKFGGVAIVSEAVHKTVDGRRFLLTHGDLESLVGEIGMPHVCRGRQVAASDAQKTDADTLEDRPALQHARHSSAAFAPRPIVAAKPFAIKRIIFSDNALVRANQECGGFVECVKGARHKGRFSTQNNLPCRSKNC